jgi:hypothetical protein
MDNETTTTTETNLAVPADAGPSNLISDATKAAERLENANKELARLLAIQEEIQVKKMLDGKADTGVKQETQEEKEKAEARKLLEGTGMEDYAFPPDIK